MNKLRIAFDITKHKLVEHDVLRMALVHIVSLEEYRDHVVYPSITAISDKLDEISKSSDEAAVFMLGDFEELKKSTIQGFIIAVQSMWERGFRGMLSACESKMHNGIELIAIKKAKWIDKKGGLQDHFQRLIGISMRSFTSYDDLDLLLKLSNGIRHGDGHSSNQVYGLCPSLWPYPAVPEQTPPFSEIVVPIEALQQMIQSVIWFWEDVENIRCNSFKLKAPIVERKLLSWSSDIHQRALKRVWNVL